MGRPKGKSTKWNNLNSGEVRRSSRRGVRGDGSAPAAAAPSTAVAATSSTHALPPTRSRSSRKRPPSSTGVAVPVGYGGAASTPSSATGAVVSWHAPGEGAAILPRGSAGASPAVPTAPKALAPWHCDEVAAATALPRAGVLTNYTPRRVSPDSVVDVPGHCRDLAAGPGSGAGKSAPSSTWRGAPNSAAQTLFRPISHSPVPRAAVPPEIAVRPAPVPLAVEQSVKRQRLCRGVYDGNFGAALSMAGRMFVNTGHELLKMAAQPGGGMVAFANSCLAASRDLLMPYRGMELQRPESPEDGFVFSRVGCTGHCSEDEQRCDVCAAAQKVSRNYVQRSHNPQPERAHRKTRIEYIAGDPALASIEIRALRDREKELMREKARMVFVSDLNKHGIHVTRTKLDQIRVAVDKMDSVITTALEEGGAQEELEVWRLHKQHLDQVHANGGKGRGKKAVVHPVLLNWAIAFLARTSASVYNEVAKVMQLPHISYIYRKTAELVSTMGDKAYAVNMDTIRTIGARATKEGWTDHQRRGCLGQDSASLHTIIEHDYVSNTLVGGDESHRLGGLTHMFQLLAQEVRDAQEEEAESDGEGSTARPHNSIMDELKLAKEHLVFKWTSIDPNVKCSEIVASINVNKVTPEIITEITEILGDTMPVNGLECVMETSDAAGCNWVAFKDIMATHSIHDVLPAELMAEYPEIDFDIMCVCQDPDSKEFFLFLPDMPHLTKNIVTAIELSANKTAKRDIKYGKCPVNLGMIEEIWLETGGATGQFHDTKLTIRHFAKNAFTRMCVSLAMQVLSMSVALMIREAIADVEIELSLRVKGMYNHVADLCENWNTVVDICNGREGAHTPANARERQRILLDVLKWFSGWRALHDELVAKDKAGEYNFFADETWFCIRALILGHVATIEMYCVQQGESVNPSSMNTDTVEWTFGDFRGMAMGSTNKMTARGATRAGKKANAFNAAKYSLVGNNATGANHFGRQKRY
ncbi:hypothetical protein ACHAXT_013039 [Thalassiosira profunda]